MKIEVERNGGVGFIWLNDQATMNSIDTAMVEEINHGISELSDARCLVLSGRGKAFCSGANLNGNGGEMPGDEDGVDMGATLESHVNPLMLRIRDLPIPVISRVRGAAAGVGCALALAADLIIASDNAYFLQAFTRIGLVPDGGSSFLIARAVGRPRAMEMMLLGEKIMAAQALEWGLINRVVADAELDDAVTTLAERLASGPTRSLGFNRRVVWGGTELGWEDSLAMERHFQREAGRTSDFSEGVTAFLEKRTARFTGA
jgi:2-(1,2-epoxy-1,2-dihydrophenyl)acetyl-CoA isomerase